MTFFSTHKPTIEEAQALHKPALFSPAAVFQTPNGYVMVSHCDPLLNVWQPYKRPQEAINAR